MAFVPDEAILNFHELTAAEIKVFSFYCKVRNRKTGGWRCTDSFVAERLKLSRSRVCEARIGLIEKQWIRTEDKHFVFPLFGFEAVEKSTADRLNNENRVEISTIHIDNSISNVEHPTKSVDNSTKYSKKDQPPYQADLPNQFTSRDPRTNLKRKDGEGSVFRSGLRILVNSEQTKPENKGELYGWRDTEKAGMPRLRKRFESTSQDSTESEPSTAETLEAIGSDGEL